MSAPTAGITGNTPKIPFEKVKAIRDYLACQPDVAAVFLFGSFGTEFQGKYSDIDLGAVFFPGAHPDLRRQLSIEAGISLLLETDDIDLVNLNSAPLQLRYRAIAEGIILFESDPDTVSSFMEETYRLFGDYQIDLKTYYKEYRFALREAYLND